MNLTENLQTLQQTIEQYAIPNEEALEQFRLQFLSKKGAIPELFKQLKEVSPAEKKAVGQIINTLKNLAEEKFKQAQSLFAAQKEAQPTHQLDLSLPPIPDTLGAVHPISSFLQQILEIFKRIGFNVSEGPEIEDDWHNFTALNFPPNHPAREMQDTFFVEKNPDIALRTHTSSVQIRVMENQKPPIRTLSPGRVYRNEAISARSHCFFHQIEGLYVDKNVSFADLKQTLYYFAREMFGKDVKIRFRPSYFPFTEPSAEMDIYKGTATEADDRLTKGTGWLEILGCGMVDPNVLASCQIDPEEYSGFAFGMGLERMVLLKFGIEDLRMFSENDVRFLRQFARF